MKAAFFLGNQSFEVGDVPIPKIGDGDILIKNMACGVCGTDVHIYHGEPGSADVNPPIVLGHEYAGEVVRVGAAVQDVKVGDHVTVDPNIYCGKCSFCRDGKKQMCPSMEAIGVTRDGGFAEYSVVPASQAFCLNPDIPFEFGAMAEPVACCLHGIDLAQIKTGDTVCIVGGGAIGLIMVQLARLSGAAKVLLSEPNEKRRAAAKRLGVDETVNPLEENCGERFFSLTGEEGADVVIECVGNIPAVQSAFQFAKKGATVLLFSVPKVDAVYELPLFDVFKKELTIKGSFVNPCTHRRAVELINSSRLDFEPILTHSFGVEKLKEAIFMQMSDESIKVVVKPNYQL